MRAGPHAPTLTPIRKSSATEGESSGKFPRLAFRPLICALPVRRKIATHRQKLKEASAPASRKRRSRKQLLMSPKRCREDDGERGDSPPQKQQREDGAEEEGDSSLQKQRREGHGGMEVMAQVSSSTSQFESMFQRYVDQAQKYQEMTSRKIEGLCHELRQQAGLISSLYLNHTRLEPRQEHDATTKGSNTNIQLRFLNNLRMPIYTEKIITDKNNTAIKVAIFDGDNMITSGPLSRVTVEILVLRGNFSNNEHEEWTEEEFERHIAQDRDGEDLVLGTARLSNGEVELSQIRFKEASCRRKFIMAARVFKREKTGLRVQEAITNPVIVLDRRNESNEKRYPPRLDDEVYRLEEIARDGVYHKRLQDANIYKLECFLKALNKDSNKLRGILKMEKAERSWSRLTTHARQCVLEDKHELIKRFQNVEGNVVLFFNCVHDLVGAEFNGVYVTCDKLDPAQKVLVNKWKEHAYNELEAITHNCIMIDNIPKLISSPAEYQGTGSTEILPLDDINHVTGSFYSNKHNDPMITNQDKIIHEVDQQDTLKGNNFPSSQRGSKRVKPLASAHENNYVTVRELEQIHRCIGLIVCKQESIQEQIQFLTQKENLTSGKLDNMREHIQVLTQKEDSVLSKLESVAELIQNVTQRKEKIKSSCHNLQNHDQLVQGVKIEGPIAEAEGLASDGGESKTTRFHLRFLNEMDTPTYHDDELKSESSEAIKIGIFDGDTAIKSGPLSKVKVEIVALEGDFPYDALDQWTAKKFNEHIASSRDGKGHVLVGEGITAKLINGECYLGSIKFIEGSCKARKGMFIVGARVCEGERTGVRVQEAIMRPVKVWDRRHKLNEKSNPPKLTDGVHRLVEIGKDGKKRLEEKGIFTVQDLLKVLFKDPENLASILRIKMESKAWKKMINHAKQCCLKGKNKLKSYHRAGENVVLFFNCVHYLVGATFNDGYIESDKFSPAQQDLVDELKEGAYNQLDFLPEDHVMTNNLPVLISMDSIAGSGAAPSYMSSATHKNCSGRLFAHQAVEGFNHSLSVPNHQSLHNNQVGGIPVPALEVSNHARVESFCANDIIDLSQNTVVGQEHLSSACLTDLSQDPFQGQDFSFGTTYASNIHQFATHVSYADDDLTFLPDECDSGNCGTPALDQRKTQMHLFSPDNDTFQASTSAHINTILTPIPGTPRSTQGSMESQMQVPWAPNDGVPVATDSAQQALPQSHHSNVLPGIGR
ncbi:unnamed protein product [Urochloa humidicola]